MDALTILLREDVEGAFFPLNTPEALCSICYQLVKTAFSFCGCFSEKLKRRLVREILLEVAGENELLASVVCVELRAFIRVLFKRLHRYAVEDGTEVPA